MADTGQAQPLHVFAGGLWRPGRIRRILTLAGVPPRVGVPRRDGLVGVWGQSPHAWRGERIAQARSATLVRIEDAFLRSVLPGRTGSLPLGLLIDRTGGVHFDPAHPSALETLLARDPLNDPDLLARARLCMARMTAAQISKYTLHLPNPELPPPGYVLVVDQTRNDASLRASGADAQTFQAMLAAAQADHPDAPILIKTHPETALGLRPGHFGPTDAGGRVTLTNAALPIPALLGGARAVYTVSSQLGFEAILAGQRPVVFGRPFYAGWGLCDERHGHPLPRRGRCLTPEQVFAAAMILAPTWYDPCRDRLTSLETVIDQIEAEARQWREDRVGHVALGMRIWKHAHLQRHFGRHRRLIFAKTPAQATALANAQGRGLLVWGAPAAGMTSHQGAGTRWHVEEAFLRSRGLGADLHPPLSLVADDLGIYYDPTRPSRLEALIAAPCPPGGEARAKALIALICRAGLGKYNIGADNHGRATSLPAGLRLLIPGQVEDDASVLLGAGTAHSNLDMIKAARTAHPDAVIVYKPHPDVEADLRRGAIPPAVLTDLGVHSLPGLSSAAAIDLADAVWTMTSTLGFEALLRGKPVTCLGMPFYAGWGLTHDLTDAPKRRSHHRPSLAAFAHAVLIAYPRYLDPISGLPCTAEVAAERLAAGHSPRRGAVLGLLAALQCAFASPDPFWR